MCPGGLFVVAFGGLCVGPEGLSLVKAGGMFVVGSGEKSILGNRRPFVGSAVLFEQGSLAFLSAGKA